MNGRMVVAVLIGGVVDIVATNVLAMPVAVYVVLQSRASSGVPSSQTLAHAFAQPGIAATLMLLGAVASVIGGYTAARIARRNALLAGALSAYLCTIFGVIGLVHDTTGTPLILHLAGFVASPALGLAGGYLRLLSIRRVVAA